MVKAGDATDAVIEELAAVMEQGDIIIDGGNALYTDTIRREASLRERGLHFVGAGISGGEEGALNGPSIMPGGPKESYQALGPLLEVDRRAGRRHPLLHPHRPRRVGPLRQDGAQRHRVRRHAADRRGLQPVSGRARLRRRPDRRRVRRVEHRRLGELPRRDHRGGAAAEGRQDRAAARRRHRRRRRTEGHRPLDGEVGAGPRHPGDRYRGGGVRPRTVRLPPPARRREGPGVRHARREAGPTPRNSPRTSARRSTPRRSSPTRRASTRSRRAAPNTTGASTLATSRPSGAAAASSAPAS